MLTEYYLSFGFDGVHKQTAYPSFKDQIIIWKFALETKNTRKNENLRFGFIKSLHMHNVVCKAAYAT